jgi:hypothetical protein
MYSVTIKKPGSIFSRTFKDVKGDGLIWFEDRDRGQQVVQARYLILEDGRRIEIPLTVVIEFSAEREAVIREGLSKEAGQAVIVNKAKKK